MSSKDWLEKDYYKILGVSKNASADDIKKAFRKIARENHPDAHPGDAKREQRFKEASEANSVLSDPAQRKEYDQTRALGPLGGARFGPGGGGFGGFQGMPNRGNVDASGFGDIFSSFFGGAGQAQQARGPRRGGDIEGETTIDFADAVFGTTINLRTTGESACSVCSGTGVKPGSATPTCETCNGSGTVSRNTVGFSIPETCPTCHGRGVIVKEPCLRCHGTGSESITKSIQANIPAGVTDGQRIRLKGRGGAGVNGGPAGDLILLVHVRPHNVFGRTGDNLTVEVPVTFVEAALGADIEVPTLPGPTVTLRIPEGTRNGRIFRVRGKGVARSGRETGDLLVTVVVQVPDHLDIRAKDALRAYAKLANEPDPRVGLRRGD